MAKPKFTLSASISISDPTIEAEIQQAFDNAYRNERGSDESLSEFMARKIEEQILSIYSNQNSNASAAEAIRTVTKDITAAATIKVRKDKPPVEAPVVVAEATVPAAKSRPGK